MSVLGFDEYYESHTDGLQVLRYNLTQAYIPHMDYLDNSSKLRVCAARQDPGNNAFLLTFDCAALCSLSLSLSYQTLNRMTTIRQEEGVIDLRLFFSTVSILVLPRMVVPRCCSSQVDLYNAVSDLRDEDGGETVFSQAPPAGETELRSSKDVIRELRQSSSLLDNLTPGSWEEDMTAKCRTRLAVKPHKSRAVLFYSQLPNGEQDPMSKHGGCPVLAGTKW